MPIKPENLARYPKNWKDIRAQILERANHCCEFCGVRNYGLIQRFADGSFSYASGNIYYDLFEYTKSYTEASMAMQTLNESAREMEGVPLYIVVVLTIAHLDHTPENCGQDNLKALCQKCHLNYDHGHHQQNARATRRNKLAAAELF